LENKRDSLQISSHRGRLFFVLQVHAMSRRIIWIMLKNKQREKKEKEKGK